MLFQRKSLFFVLFQIVDISEGNKQNLWTLERPKAIKILSTSRNELDCVIFTCLEHAQFESEMFWVPYPLEKEDQHTLKIFSNVEYPGTILLKGFESRIKICVKFSARNFD